VSRKGMNDKCGRDSMLGKPFDGQVDQLGYAVILACSRPQSRSQSQLYPRLMKYKRQYKLHYKEPTMQQDDFEVGHTAKRALQ